MRKAVRYLIALMAAGIFAPLLQAQPRWASSHAIHEGAYYIAQRHRRSSRFRHRRHRRQLRRHHLHHHFNRLRRDRLRRSRPGIHFDLRHHRRHHRPGFSIHFGYRDY